MRFEIENEFCLDSVLGGKVLGFGSIDGSQWRQKFAAENNPEVFLVAMMRHVGSRNGSLIIGDNFRRVRIIAAQIIPGGLMLVDFV